MHAYNLTLEQLISEVPPEKQLDLIQCITNFVNDNTDFTCGASVKLIRNYPRTKCVRVDFAITEGGYKEIRCGSGDSTMRKKEIPIKVERE